MFTESIAQRDQSNSPREPSSSRMRRCSFAQTRAAVHSVYRRCAVGPDGPKTGGNCRQVQPVVATKMIAASTSRSPYRRRPPPCGRDGAGGTTRWNSSHNSSGTMRSTITTRCRLPSAPNETTSKATYGYTAYGSEDESEFTGIDKPDANDPTKETYNPYRYNAKRWDAQSGTYDMGFRDYNPGLNRFTTRDMYNGALADMNLGVDPYTGNRYAFTGGNPTSFVEFDGHFSITDIAKDVLKFAGKRNPVGLVSSVSGLLFDFDPVGDAVDTVVGEIFGETESRWYQAKDYDKGRFLTPDGEVETDPGIGSGDLPPSCLNGGQTWVFYQPLDDQGRATGMHACLNKGDFNYSKDNGEAAFPDNDATAIWAPRRPGPSRTGETTRRA